MRKKARQEREGKEQGRHQPQGASEKKKEKIYYEEKINGKATEIPTGRQTAVEGRQIDREIDRRIH